MKHTSFSLTFIKLFALVTLCFSSFAFTRHFGLDSYEIFLNKKLILKQNVNEPLNLRVLQLDKAKDNDLLRINYRHCMMEGAGTDRNIVIKDEAGNTLKKWAFADATGADLSMTIPVKELLLLEKSNSQHQLSIYYTAKQLAKSQLLVSLRVK